LAPIPGVPAGDYHGAWIYAPNDIVLGNTLGHLVRYDGARWTVTDTGTGESVFRLWGADDGTLFFITPTYFGRVVGTQVDLFRIIAEGEPPQSVGPGGSGTFDSFPPSHDIFQDLWGNSSTEVFVGVHAAGFAENRCGGVFALWFDGEAFHVF
jgi:hypothetical protein